MLLIIIGMALEWSWQITGRNADESLVSCATASNSTCWRQIVKWNYINTHSTNIGKSLRISFIKISSEARHMLSCICVFWDMTCVCCCAMITIKNHDFSIFIGKCRPNRSHAGFRKNVTKRLILLSPNSDKHTSQLNASRVHKILMLFNIESHNLCKM